MKDAAEYILNAIDELRLAQDSTSLPSARILIARASLPVMALLGELGIGDAHHTPRAESLKEAYLLQYKPPPAATPKESRDASD